MSANTKITLLRLLIILNGLIGVVAIAALADVLRLAPKVAQVQRTEVVTHRIEQGQLVQLKLLPGEINRIEKQLRKYGKVLVHVTPTNAKRIAKPVAVQPTAPSRGVVPGRGNSQGNGRPGRQRVTPGGGSKPHPAPPGKAKPQPVKQVLKQVTKTVKQVTKSANKTTKQLTKVVNTTIKQVGKVVKKTLQSVGQTTKQVQKTLTGVVTTVTTLLRPPPTQTVTTAP